MFFCYGSSPASWIAGNDVFSVTSGLSGPLAAAWDELGNTFHDKSMTGSRIRWISTSPTGLFCIMLKDGSMMSNVPGLTQAVAQRQQQRWGVQVDHVAFAPSGSWIIIFNDCMVQVSPQPQFSASFYALAGRFMRFDSPSVSYPQPSQVRHILFGADDIFIINANLTLFWSYLPPALNEALGKVYVKPGDGFWNTNTTHLLTYNSVLSPFDSGSYVLEATPKVPVFGQGMAYEFGGSHVAGTLPPQAFVELATGNRLGPHLLPAPQQGTSSASAATVGAYQTPPPNTEKPDLSSTTPSSFHASPAPPPYTALSLPPPPPLPPHTPSTTFPSAASDPIPAAQRRKFEAQFDANCQGKSFLTGMEASVLLTESGLDKNILSDIWEKTDIDRNGRFDKEEFVQAMWLISLERDGGAGNPEDEPNVNAAVNSAKGTRPCDSHLECDGCRIKMWPGSTCYHCETCNGGDFDLCDTCHSNPFKQCSHKLELRTIVLRPTGSMNLGSVNQGYGGQGKPVSFLDQFFQTGSSSEPSEMEKMTKQFQDTKLKDSLLSSIVSEKPNIKWEDVAGLEAAKNELQEAIIFPLKFPHMFQGKRKARKAILMYGPPGTGKSYLAKAVATEVDHTLFSISSGDVMSKWFGESEGLVRGLFQLAREKKPSIIFIDEIDALCSNRESSGSGDGSNELTARMKTEFLVQLDGVGNDNDGVLVLAATNLPWALDPAVRRRFQKRIHIPLPDEPARRQLFRIHGGEHFAGFSEQEFGVMARQTEGCSGSDVANLVQDALMVPVKKVYGATHFRKVTSGNFEWLAPCQPHESGAIPMTWKQVPSKQLKEPELSAHDVFEVALNTKPSVGKEEVQKCHQWTQQYGVEGA